MPFVGACVDGTYECPRGCSASDHERKETVKGKEIGTKEVDEQKRGGREKNSGR